jgi:hypothetical protein
MKAGQKPPNRQQTRHSQGTSPRLHLPPSNPLRTPHGQVLTLGNQTLVERTGQDRDAVPASSYRKCWQVMLTAPGWDERRRRGGSAGSALAMGVATRGCAEGC